MLRKIANILFIVLAITGCTNNATTEKHQTVRNKIENCYQKVKEFQMDMLAFFDREHKEIGKAIDEKKVLDDELKEQILAAAKEFKERR